MGAAFNKKRSCWQVFAIWKDPSQLISLKKVATINSRSYCQIPGQNSPYYIVIAVCVWIYVWGRKRMCMGVLFIFFGKSIFLSIFLYMYYIYGYFTLYICVWPIHTPNVCVCVLYVCMCCVFFWYICLSFSLI